MTNTGYYTASPSTATLPEFRDNVEASLGKARERTWVTHTTAVTLDATSDYVNADATSGAFTVTLPASPTTGHEYVVRKSDASGNAVTVDGNGNDINGSGTASLAAQYDRIRVSFDGSEWARVD